MNAQEILDREFLTIRAKILELGASLDRIDRADNDVSADPKMINIRKALNILNDSSADRVNRVQLLFSRDYQPKWLDSFQLQPRF
jgi:hypothetical protein